MSYVNNETKCEMRVYSHEIRNITIRNWLEGCFKCNINVNLQSILDE